MDHFYPRPPRGGRLAHRAEPVLAAVISIHALREEGDIAVDDVTAGMTEFLSTPSARRATKPQEIPDYGGMNFYPRPPRGGRRRAVSRSRPRGHISIHALREEGDPSSSTLSIRPQIFLSTPSARRATAKTETKSLFSYKLYNILHEFRRALIYNGSKNYPNHAK